MVQNNLLTTFDHEKNLVHVVFTKELLPHVILLATF